MTATLSSYENEPDIVEARAHIDRALGGISTLHLGPLDWNVSSTIDDLLVAIRLIERFGKDRRS